MDRVKIKYFCDCYSRVLGLSKNLNALLYELICNISEYYETRVPKIPASLDCCSSSYLIKPNNGYFSVEDFFLNRLMRNIWYVDLIKNNTSSKKLQPKGCFYPSSQTLCLNVDKLNRQFDRFANYFSDIANFNSSKSLALKKVIMHEFEHGLQTRYDDKLDSRYREVYKKISDEINNNNTNNYQIRRYEDFPKTIYDTSNYLSTGTHIGHIMDDGNKKTYRDVNGFDNLNEILNESESLIMSKQKCKLSFSIGNDGNYINLSNPESSNNTITCYGFLLKCILGHKSAFKLMYIDPISGFQDFNNSYSDIFQEVYNNDKDATTNFITAITDIKNTGDEKSHIKLQTALAKCLKKKILKFYDKKSVSNNEMKSLLKNFKYFSIKNLDSTKRNEIESNKILMEVENIIKGRFVLDNSVELDSMFEELNSNIDINNNIKQM